MEAEDRRLLYDVCPSEQIPPQSLAMLYPSPNNKSWSRLLVFVKVSRSSLDPSCVEMAEDGEPDRLQAVNQSSRLASTSFTMFSKE